VKLDISVVTFRPDAAAFARMLASLAEQADGIELALLVHDNTPAAERPAWLDARDLAPGFARVDVRRSDTNAGFGAGHNANVARGSAPFVLVLNQDCVLEPGVLPALVGSANDDDARVAAWELRQIPYEHPKAYDPASLETPWVSGAAVLLRRAAFDEVRGFDPRLFMYGEDVDLSWRLRARGWKLRYLPRCGVVHRTYRHAGEVKPLQALSGVQTNLCLRARFGGPLETARGIALLLLELGGPQDFAGRRRGLLGALAGFLRRWPWFALSRVRPRDDFRPVFAGWGYELRRDGAFYAFRSTREAPRPATPLVSVLIRTIGRNAWLAEALASVANQTWPNVEAIVIEDGPPTARATIDRFAARLRVRYVATGEKVGRARAGNLALREARGEWLNFLDDDDVLFADHVEVLMETVLARGVKGAYALAWETATEVLDRERATYRETAHHTRHHQPFDRLTLWHHNFLPIQAVLFHRSLYECHGGFREDMDQLEDWNLWTRYTLENPFVLVEKTTSKYRVPAHPRDAAARQVLLDQAYRDAVELQRTMRLTLSPLEITQMAEAYVRSQALLVVSRRDMRRFVDQRPWLARLAAFRAPLLRRLRRRSAA
jgi:GT2 family glycosyltransferase